MGTRLVQVPTLPGWSQKGLADIPEATCDDPAFKVFSAHQYGGPSSSKLEEDECSSRSSEPQQPETSGSSSQNSTGFGKGSRLDPDSSVVLTMENMSQNVLRVMVIFGSCFSCGSFSLAIVLIILDALKKLPDNHTNQMDIWSLVAGVPCLVIAIVLLSAYSGVLIKCRQQGARWSYRRRYLAMINLAILICNELNVVFFIMPSIYALGDPCKWMSAVVYVSAYLRWSFWNALLLLLLVQVHNAHPWTDQHGRKVCRKALRDALWSILWSFTKQWRSIVDFLCGTCLQPISDLAETEELPILSPVEPGNHPPNLLIMDAPLIIHLPKAITWALLQMSLTAQLILILVLPDDGIVIAGSNNCQTRQWICVYQIWQIPVPTLVSLFWLFYLVLFMKYLYTGMQHVKQLPYASYRLGRLLTQLYAHGNVAGIISFFVCQIVAGSVRPDTQCIFYAHAWVDLPLTLMVTGVSVSLAFLFMPRLPGKSNPYLQAGLQIFAWAESQIEARKQHRERYSGGSKSLSPEPMFCFERALKLLYFSALAYDIEEVDAAGLKEDVAAEKGSDDLDKKGKQRCVIQEALGLFDLTAHRLLFEPLTDTKAVVAWNDATILVSFRGTASMKAAKLDLKAHRVCHPPKRGSGWRHTMPCVHAGFLASWHGNGFNQTLLDLIWKEILKERMPQPQPRIIVTGHSLGGALATLAAFDIAKELQLRDISVVTFGAPRTGNRAFAREYEQYVPDTWHMINAKDPVTHLAKFGGFYKRCGHRVLVSANGEMLVRPSYLELRAHFATTKLRTRVKDHYLRSYRQVFLNVLRTQLGPRGVDSGVEGCLHLAQSVDLKQLLPMADAQLSQAETAALHGTLPRVASQPVLGGSVSILRQALSMSTPMTAAKSEELSKGSDEAEAVAKKHPEDQV